MAVTAALWLAGGSALVVLAWMATPDSFPGLLLFPWVG